MKCENWQELILERELLAPAAQQRLEQHLASCTGCRAWQVALTEVESSLTMELRSQLDLAALRRRISRAVARERPWIKAVPEALEALGWSALGALALAGVLLASHGPAWHLWLAGAGTVGASLVWALRALWNEPTTARRSW